MRKSAVFSAFLCIGLLAATHPAPFVITPPIQAALKRISADSMRGNLSFLASDLLEGRDTPSRGLDIAAEFIASQFRRAGLEPAGDNGYFQTAKLKLQEPNTAGFELTLSDDRNTVSVTSEQTSIRVNQPLDLAQAPIFKLDLADAALVEKLTPAQLDRKAVFIEMSRGGMQRGRLAFSKIRGSNPAVVLTLERKGSEGIGHESAQLFDPENQTQPQAPRLTISSPEAARFYDDLKPGLSAMASLTAHVAGPKEQAVVLRNVTGILRGSDPALKDTCVVVSAHYDHIGEKTSGEGDRIFNGANDDGSGTVSVIELANALAHMEPRPRRSIVFVTFFGEEKGGFGSRYFARHPVLPIANTVANINLEQLGRTDSSEGEQKSNASLTGFDYSNVADFMTAAGGLTGVKVYKHERNSDLYFAASDNVSLAEVGVPAHTVGVTFNFPDYHGVGDEWPKIDYANMAKVDRMVAVALLMLADSPDAPHWNAGNPKAARYLKAWQAIH